MRLWRCGVVITLLWGIVSEFARRPVWCSPQLCARPRIVRTLALSVSSFVGMSLCMPAPFPWALAAGCGWRWPRPRGSPLPLWRRPTALGAWSRGGGRERAHRVGAAADDAPRFSGTIAGRNGRRSGARSDSASSWQGWCLEGGCAAKLTRARLAPLHLLEARSPPG